MNLVNIFSQGYNNIKEMFAPKAASKTAHAEQTKPKVPAHGTDSAHTMQKGESVKTTSVKQGTAQIKLEKSNEEQIKEWIEAGKGEKVDLGAFSDKPLEPVMKLQAYILDKYGKDSPEAKNMGEFLKGVDSEQGKDSKFHLADRIREHGISHKQVEMLVNGDFSASAYMDAVKSGQPAM